MKVWIFLFSFFIIPFVFGDTGTPPYDPTDDLLKAFGSQCTSYGDLSQKAVSQSNSLIGIIAAMQSDPNCRPLTDALTGLNADMLPPSSADPTIPARTPETLQSIINDETAALQLEKAKVANHAQDADPALVTAIQTSLETDKVQMIKLQQDRNYQLKVYSFTRIQNLYGHAKNVLDAIQMNQACLTGHPGLIASVGAQILGASSDWASGTAGAALLATGSIIDRLVDFIRQYSLAGHLKNIVNGKFGLALGCSLEGLAATYCQSRDTGLVIEANARNQANPNACGWEGVNIVGRDMPSFLNEVSRLYAGSDPSSSAQQQDKSKGTNLRGDLIRFVDTMTGMIADTDRNLKLITGTDPNADGDRERLRRGLIANLSNVIGLAGTQNNCIGSGVGPVTCSETPGPVGNVFTQDSNCGVFTFFYSGGKSFECLDKKADEFTCEACVKRRFFGGNPVQVPSVDAIRQRRDELRKLAENYVNVRVSAVRETNPDTVLAAFDVADDNRKNARIFLQNTKAYLESLIALAEQTPPQGIAVGRMRAVVDNALDEINKTLAVLDSIHRGIDAKKDAKDVSDLSDLLAPLADTAHLAKKLTLIVRQDVDQKLKEGKIDATLSVIMQNSLSDPLSQFLATYQSLDAIRNQVRSAEDITETNLGAVWDTFGDKIEQNLKDLKERSAKDPKNKRKWESLSLYCLRTLLAPKPKNFGGPQKPNYCYDVKYRNVYGDTDSELDYKALLNKPFEERVCSLYDFYRRSRLKGLAIDPAKAQIH